jgi:deoxyribodipyrimidine photolyase-related protein
MSARLLFQGAHRAPPGRPLHLVGPADLDPTLAGFPRQPDDGAVVIVESAARRAAFPWHRQKLALLLSAWRHLAQALADQGFDVRIYASADLRGGLEAAGADLQTRALVCLAPREVGYEAELERLRADGWALTVHDDGGPGGHFLLRRAEVFAWAQTQRPPYRMDAFYRHLRRRLGLLLDASGKPLGGKWSFDADNRQVPKGERPPPPPAHPPDALTRAELARVQRWPGLWGQAEPFDWPVDRAGAQRELADFVAHRLPRFGAFQDAMVDGQPFLWHARLSPALNLGLLHPRELVDAAVAALEAGAAPLASVEGFVRQVIGWREFIRAMYLLRMPGLREANGLGAELPLPAAFWEPGAAGMRCVDEAVRDVHARGYAHHIQRLMVLGNLGLLLGVRPIELSRWFRAAFVDASEWVELPNVHGMALFADDGFTTKPYVASGAYIDRMGDHCGRCRFDVRQRTGPTACPYNSLFWDFMARHRARLGAHPRLGMLLRTWDGFPADEQQRIRETADLARARLGPPAARWSFDDDAA